MTAQPVEEDGNLPAALRALDTAIHQLTEPKSKLHQNNVVNGPSLYMQLWDAVQGENTNGGGAGGGSKSRPPVWIDALDLCAEIDTALECWQPAYTGTPATVGRCHWLNQRKWRPQDTRRIEQYATTITTWATKITELMDPPPRWSLPYPCPNCNTTHVYRQDNGERIRSYALQLSAEGGCTCTHCKTNWPQGQLLFLGRLLNTVPTNIGE